jgi:hypothetical protein
MATNLPVGDELLQGVAGDAEETLTSLVERLWSAKVDDALHRGPVAELGVVTPFTLLLPAIEY